MPGPNHIADDILQARAGDRTAFGRVMDAYLPLAHRLSSRWLSDDDAKDVCQEAFLRVWEHLPRFDVTRPFEAWLTTIVTRLCFDRLRRQQRSPLRWIPGMHRNGSEPVSSGPTPERIAEGRDLMAAVLVAMRQLPPTQRIVFALRDLEDLEVADVVAVSGLTEGSVKTNLSYARRTLRRILVEDFQMEEVER